jgi:hypothetical protein
MHAIMNVHMEIEGMFASLQLLGSRDRSDPVYAR